MNKQLSEYEKVFGEGTAREEDIYRDLGTIRNDFDEELTKFIPKDSLMSPSCCLFAIYKILEKGKKDERD